VARAGTVPRAAAVIRAAALIFAVGFALVPAASARAAAATDITSQVLAGQNVTLSGPSVVTLPAGTTTYNGVFSGQGTLTIAGSGTLVLTKDSDFTLPAAQQHQSVTTSGGNWPYPIVADPDPPAVIVDPGATLQYGGGGSAGIIGSYPYKQVSGLTLNQDNIEVGGTLVLDITSREYNLGTISGSGLISQPRSTWGTLDLADDLPFSGTIGNGTGMNFGSAAFRLSLPDASAVDNDGSAIISARNYTLVLPQSFYENHFGDDINFHTWQAGLIEMTGTDHYTDPSLDTAALSGNANYRGINIEGANVQWGNGTSDRFFLPATPANSYINIHDDGSLAFDYDGPVTLDTPISGGVYTQSLSTPANASVTLSPTPGNTVTFATPMNYHGLTTIGAGAALVLGTGTAGGDSSLLTGAANDEIADDGSLTVRDTATAVTLANIGGTGSLTQAGGTTTTLSGSTDYTGPTTITAGTLALGPGAGGIAASSGVTLAGAGAELDLSRAGDQSVKRLSGVPGSRVVLGGGTLTVAADGSYSGTISGTGGGLTVGGSGTLTLAGRADTPGGTWRLDRGKLALAPTATVELGSLIQAAGSTLSLRLASAAAKGTSAAPVQASGAVRLGGKLVIAAMPRLTAGQSLVLIHDSGTKQISGTFTGLPQGKKLVVDGTTLEIDYQADGGHAVALTAPAPTPRAVLGGRPDSAGRSPSAVTRVTRVTPVALTAAAAGAALLACVVVLLVRRRRRPGRPAGTRPGGWPGTMPPTGPQARPQAGGNAPPPPGRRDGPWRRYDLGGEENQWP
jgi:autotransporter-associated beta strand protein